MSINGRNLTPDEVNTVLSALENFITSTAEAAPKGFSTPWDWSNFVMSRDRANIIWYRAIRTINGPDENELVGDPDEHSNE